MCGAARRWKPNTRRNPAVGINLADAEELCRKLTRILADLGATELEIRIPTIAEWGALDTGVDEEYPVNLKAAAGGMQHPVSTGISGRSQSGLWDVYGNVSEWTRTCWGSDQLDSPGHGQPYVPNGVWDDPSCTGFRLLRGGSWLFSETGPRCACLLPPEARFADVGFRPCLVGPVETAGRVADRFIVTL